MRRYGLIVVIGLLASCDRTSQVTTERRDATTPTTANPSAGQVAGAVTAGTGPATPFGTKTAIVGETPNIAARLEGLAEPGSVLISDSTHSLTEGLFICESLGPLLLRGISKPVAVYRVEGETTALYIQRLLEDRPVKMTRLATGIPVGGALAYTDEVTLQRAFQFRRQM